MTKANRCLSMPNIVIVGLHVFI